MAIGATNCRVLGGIMAILALLVELLSSLAVAAIGGFFLLNTFAFSGEADRSGEHNTRLIVFGFLGLIAVCIPLLLSLRAAYQQYHLHSSGMGLHLLPPAIALLACLALVPVAIIGAEGGLTLDLIREFRAPTLYYGDFAKNPDDFKRQLKKEAKSLPFIPDRFISEINFGEIPMPSGWYGWLDGSHIFMSQDVDQLVSLDAERIGGRTQKEVHTAKSKKKTTIGSREWLIEEKEGKGQTTISLEKFAKYDDVYVMYRVTLHYPASQPQERAALMNIVSAIKIYGEDRKGAP